MDAGYVIPSFLYLFSASDQSSINKRQQKAHTLTKRLRAHSPCTTHQTYTKAVWQSCPWLALLSCPSHSHRAVTLVSSSCTLLESQHLSRDGLTLLSDIL